MAKKQAPDQFLAQLGSDPELLGNFIMDPDGTMDQYNVPAKARADVRSAVAQAVVKNLSQAPDSYICIIV
jgi:hypothetical protein